MSKFSSPFMAKSPLNNGKKIIGEDTSEIQSDKKGEYVLHRETDTIRPPKGEIKFKPFVRGKSLGSKEGYLVGGDYTVDSNTNRLVSYK